MTEKPVAIVTGAAGGMGVAIVRRLEADGFHVAATDINNDALSALKQNVPGDVSVFQTDLTDERSARSMVHKVQTELGPVHALVNAIGWVGTTRFIEEDSAYWSKIININLKSVLYITHAVLPQMIERKFGKIVNISSDAGRIGTSGEVVYSATKAGIIAFGKSLAREHARHNIMVNSVAPGPTDTPLLREEMETDPELVKRMVRLIPFRRVGTPEEMAAAVSFFCSKDADYVTGQTLSVNGGLTML